MALLCAHHSDETNGFPLDCQAEALRGSNTRVVVPLLPPDEAPAPGARLNPQFVIGGAPYVMVTQFIASVPPSSLGPVAAFPESEECVIADALDIILTGV